MNGGTVYVRLWSLIGGVWQYTDYTYKAATQTAMSSPTPGSVLPGSSATFTWTLGTGVTSSGVWVGTSAGGSQILYGPTQSTTTATVTGLPVNGSTVYVRLWSLIGSTWRYTDYTYKATTLTALTSPARGSTLSGSSVTFTWTLAPGVTNSGLWVGTTAGASDLYYGSALAGPITTATVSGLPVNGSAIYVRLWAQVSGSWQSVDYKFTAVTNTVGPLSIRITIPQIPLNVSQLVIVAGSLPRTVNTWRDQRNDDDWRA